MSLKGLLRTAACAAALAPGCGVAQSLDYGALETLFGEPVTTSVTGSPQRISDVAASMEIITAEDIRRAGADTIVDALRNAASVDVLQWTMDSADVSVRGHNQAYSARLLVLIDGRQVYADFYGFIPWATLPVELGQIRQIEIVRGPASALFGFNALAGVINIVTYNPAYDDVNSVTVSGGTQDMSRVSAVTRVKVGNAAFQVAGGYRNNKDFATPTPPAFGATPRSTHERGEVNMTGVIRLNEKTTFTVDASHAAADPNQVNVLYILAHNITRSHSVRGRLAVDTDLGHIQATLYRNWITLDSPRTPVLGPLYLSNHVTVARLEDIFKAGTRHTFRLMGEYRHNSEIVAPFPDGDVFYDVAAASAMWDWKATSRISLTHALRVDHMMLGHRGALPADFPFTDADWDRSYTELSFDSNIMWAATPVDTLRLSANRGVQVPPLLFLGAFILEFPTAVNAGNPTNVPTRMMNYEANWDRKLPALNGLLRATAFYQSTRNILGSSGVSIPGPRRYILPGDIGRSRSYGLELSLNGRAREQWTWGVSYRLQDVNDDFIPAAKDGAAGTDHEHLSPTHQVKARLGWTQGPWEVDGFLRYQSDIFGLMRGAGTLKVLTPIDDHVTVDARVAYRLDRATLALAAHNLLQATQRQTSGQPVERRIIGSLTVEF